MDGRRGRTLGCADGDGDGDGVGVADGVAAAATAGDTLTAGAPAGLAAGGDGTAGRVTARAGGGDPRAANECTTSSVADGRGFTGVENREAPEPEVYQESTPGATTPMSGICSGPASSWKSMAAVAGRAWCAADVRPACAAGSTVVWETATSDAMVSAVAPAPSTEEVLAVRRRCALCLPMESRAFRNERASILGATASRRPPTRRR
ncbi:MAG TPA: hypothetical protein VGN28_11690 [Blastococcus sp.]|nr:hypothetical protein [Blastococcus sp.]